ncbi:MAG: SagB/ThcOx family dehydrogenase [Ignavibacteria bacterium]
MKVTIIFLAAIFIGVMVISFSMKKTQINDKPMIPAEKIKLLPAETTGGMPLMEALKKRHSERTFSSRKLDDQTLSNLMWASYGISREESGKRTAPTANNTQAMDVYVIFESGAYKYIAEDHSLELVAGKDLRTLAGKQDFVYTAPVNLVYVADYSKLKNDSNKEMYSGAHAGFIGENVYLFCASAGMNTVIRAWVDREPLEKELKLNENQKIILAQTVGYGE